MELSPTMAWFVVKMRGIGGISMCLYRPAMLHGNRDDNNPRVSSTVNGPACSQRWIMISVHTGEGGWEEWRRYRSFQQVGS